MNKQCKAFNLNGLVENIMNSSLNSGRVCVGGRHSHVLGSNPGGNFSCLLLAQAVAEASSSGMSKGREDNQFNRTTYYASLLLVESPF